MFKKRTIGFIMAMALVFSACGGAKKADNDADKKNEKEVVETAKDSGEKQKAKELLKFLQSLLMMNKQQNLL